MNELMVPTEIPLGKQVESVQLRGWIELERCERSLLYWMERYCFTRDERDRERPFKPILAGTPKCNPLTLRTSGLDQDDPDDYLRICALVWFYHKLVVIPKSRQMRLSWFAMACNTWLAQFNVAQRCAVQSKKEGDADKMLDRCVVICELERKVAPWVPWPSYKKSSALLKFDHGGLMGISRIEAIPQGGDKIRGEAYSSVFQDELAFQEEAEEAYAAAMPLMEGGSRYMAVSSASANTFFERLQSDAI